MRLEHKVAIVTGGGSGIGRAVANRFVREGAAVVVCGRRPRPIAETVAQVSAAGGQAQAVCADVTTAVGAQSLIEATVTTFGRVDILVNNAGAMITRTNAASCTEEDWHRTLDSNLTSAFLCCKFALPELMRTAGNVVLVSSIFGLVGGTNRAAYVAAKGGLVSLARGTALDFAEHGVRVNVICPAYVETDMNRELLAELRSRGEVDAVVRRHPLGRLGKPDDVAYAALYLASDEASWVTGVALPIDGGMSVGHADV